MTAIDMNRPRHEINVLDRDFIRDPWEGYARLRAEQPIFFDDVNDLWVLTRHDDVTYASIHPELFCAGQGVRPTGTFDLSLIALAVPIPMVVIAELMGLPVEDRDRFWRWSDAMMAGEGRREGDPELEAAGHAFGEYMDYVSGLVADRRANYRAAKAEGREPEGDDLISVLVAAAEEGIIDTDEDRDNDTLAEDELMMFLVVVIVAGNETTRNAISGGMWALHEFRDQWEAALARPELWASAADEIYRWVSPVISFVRTATCDATIAGHQILQGEKVLMLYQSANRDEAVFDDPDNLRLDRSPNPHLAFGVGPHVCMGINLARLEIRVLFEELSRRFPDIDVVAGTSPVWGDSTLVHAIESLPVTFTPERT